MKRIRFLPAIFVLLLLVIPDAASAGWVIKQNGKEMAFVSKGKMKSSWENGSIIVKGEENKMYFVDDVRKLVSSGTVEEFCGTLEKVRDKMMEDLSPEHREMVKKMMEGRKTPKVEVVKKGSGGKVSGFKTVRYEVRADGQLYEELWLSEDKKLLDDFGNIMEIMGKFTRCTAEMNSMGSSASPEATPEYGRIFEMGVILKSISGGGQEGDLTELEKRDIDDSTFTIPEGYKSVTFEEMWSMSMK